MLKLLNYTSATATMKCIALLFIIALSITVSAGISLYKAVEIENGDGFGSSWTDCSSSDIAEVMSLSLNPDPLIKGTNATVKITVYINEVVDGGQAKIVMKYKDMIPVKKTTVNICKLGGQGCPFETGKHVLTFRTKISSLSVSGSYTGLVKASDSNGQEILCLKLSMYIKGS